MDAVVSADNSKKRKRSEEEQCNGENDDRISNLPEHILHYILSFLPTKYAVGTSVLSTRWKSLWTFIHNLNFCDKHLYNTSSKSPNYTKRKRIFREFVDKVLHSIDASDILKCRVKCQEADAAHFNEWISTMIRHKVQELKISVFKECHFKFSDCLFTCESLRVFKINMSVSMRTPALICFSSLKILHLKSIIFSGDQSMQEISISCPLVEEFVLYYCAWLNINRVDITCPALRKLTISDWRDLGCKDCEIKIYAESLISLKFEGCFTYRKYSLCNLSSLVNVSIMLLTYNENVQRMGSFLRGICNVKNLKLLDGSIEILSRPEISTHILAFSRLIHLTVGRRARANGRAFIDLLCSMPNIERIYFPYGVNSISFKGQGRLMGTTPKCFLSHLKLVKIQHFRWIAEHVWFIKFLIKSARVVDKLTIKVTTASFDYRYRGEMPEVEIKRLQMLARNTNCVLEFF